MHTTIAPAPGRRPRAQGLRRDRSAPGLPINEFPSVGPDLTSPFIAMATSNQGQEHLAVAEFVVQSTYPIGFEQLAIENPLREELCAQLMLAFAHSGRRSDALAAYQRLRCGLGDELGIEPSSRLRDIELLVLNDELATADAQPFSTSPGVGPTERRRRGNVPIPVSSSLAELICSSG